MDPWSSLGGFHIMRKISEEWSKKICAGMNFWEYLERIGLIFPVGLDL